MLEEFNTRGRKSEYESMAGLKTLHESKDMGCLTFDWISFHGLADIFLQWSAKKNCSNI